MKAYFALALLAVVAMATADHHEGHVGTQPEVQPSPAAQPAEPAQPPKDLKSSEATYIAAPYAYTAYGAAYPYAYPYAYNAYPAYTYYG